MGHFDPKHAKHWRAIQTILMSEWDPIGVSDEPNASDEYDRYVAGIWELLESGASEEAVMHHLDGIATERMGFTSQPELARPAARSLCNLDVADS